LFSIKKVYLKTIPKITFIIVSTTLKSIAIPNPPTLKPGTIALARLMIIPLITSVNNPRVKIFTGSVRSTSSGFTNVFKRPSTIDAISAETNVTEARGSKYAVSIIATVDKSQCKIIRKKL
jgi:hypothetical protein